MYRNWSDITTHVRNSLVTAAVTQVTVGRRTKAEMLTVSALSPKIPGEITEAMHKMSAMRDSKPGKKRYGLVTGGYFGDLTRMLVNAYHVLEPGGHAVFVLGDSLPTACTSRPTC